MARGTLAVHTVDRDGLDEGTLTPIAADPTNKHQFLNNEKEWIEVANSHATDPFTVGFALGTRPTAGVDGVVIPDKTVSISALTKVKIGPFPNTLYSQGGNIVYVDPEAGSAAYLSMLVYSL